MVWCQLQGIGDIFPRIRFDLSEQELRDAALVAMRAAYAPYSGFSVGAALRTGDGRIFLGCNVENAAYGLAMCAERVAITSAIASGARSFHSLAIATDAASPTPPCGACRQVMAEFAEDLAVTSFTCDGDSMRWTVRELLPSAFAADNIRSTEE